MRMGELGNAPSPGYKAVGCSLLVGDGLLSCSGHSMDTPHTQQATPLDAYLQPGRSKTASDVAAAAPSLTGVNVIQQLAP